MSESSNSSPDLAAFVLYPNAIFSKYVDNVLQPALDSKDQGLFLKEWKEFQDFYHSHVTMEDYYISPMMSENAEWKVAEPELSRKHESTKVDIEFVNKSLRISSSINDAFNQWKEPFLDSIEKKQSVLVTSVPTLMKTHDNFGEHLHTKVVLPVWHHTKDAFVSTMTWEVQVLSTYGVADSSIPAMASTGNFLQCLQAITSPSQWTILQNSIKARLSTDVWENLVKDYAVDGPGMQKEEEKTVRPVSRQLHNAVAEKLSIQPPKVINVEAAPTPNPPIVFALMRNAHESFRKAISEVLMPSLENGNNERFLAAWNPFRRAWSMHAMMEDNYFFPILNEVSENKMSEEHFPDEHDTDRSLMAAIQQEIEANGKVSIETFNAWKDNFLKHLQHEEKVMMPLTPTLAPTPAARAELVHRRIVLPLWENSRDEFIEFIGWNVYQLSIFGSTNNTPSVACRVFIHGLQWSTTPSQWKILLPVIKANVMKNDIWDEIVHDYHIEMPGYQPEASGTSRASKVAVFVEAPVQEPSASGCKCLIS